MKYKAGDKVRVRSWESMEKEFGVNKNGSIKCRIEEVWFIKDMKKYCGEIVTIKEAIDNIYKTKEDDELWNFTDDMLEPVEFDWESFKDKINYIAVHCKTEEEAKDFCRQMHKHGMKWINGNSYLECTCWNINEKEILYTGYGTYDSYDWFKKLNYTILEWSDYFTEKEQKLLIPKKCRRVLKQLNKEYKWIVKDMNGEVYIYTKEPVRELCEWISQGRKERIDELFPKLDYSWLSFEDCEPVNFREVLKGE